MSEWGRRLLASLRRGGQPAAVESVWDWAARRSLEREELAPACTVRHPLPWTPGDAPHARFLERRERSLPPHYRAVIPSARVMGGQGMVLLPTGEAVLEVAYQREQLAAFPPFSGQRPPPVVRREGEYLSLLQRFVGAGNYYHWLCDSLPRLLGLEPLLARGVTVLVPPGLPAAQREALRRAGCRDEQVRELPVDETWEVERLHFAPPAAKSGYHRPEAVRWLRGRILDPLPAPGAPLRLFISRRGAGQRRLVNEDEVFAAFASEGFVRVDLEGLPFGEQVDLFRRAEWVVGPHGAGFANLLFAPVAARVLEFQGPSWVQYCYWTLCATQGRPYGYVMAEPVPGPEHHVHLAPAEALAAFRQFPAAPPSPP